MDSALAELAGSLIAFVVFFTISFTISTIQDRCRRRKRKETETNAHPYPYDHERTRMLGSNQQLNGEGGGYEQSGGEGTQMLLSHQECQHHGAAISDQMQHPNTNFAMHF
ncbi:unnamed protein product [Amoebophrya sp. A25]|nr:unnamed protein product [Amoebophrya sp. A25]|eukprot:GSA25T00021336001.1